MFSVQSGPLELTPFATTVQFPWAPLAIASALGHPLTPLKSGVDNTTPLAPVYPGVATTLIDRVPSLSRSVTDALYGEGTVPSVASSRL